MTPPPAPTWLLGLNRRIPSAANPHEPWLPTLQLIDIQPGQFWIPALQAELQTPIVLQPLPNVFAWRSFSANFSYNLRWRLNAPLVVVRKLITFTIAFQFTFQFALQQKLKSIISDPAGNYGIGGFASLAWGAID